jgi:hypothetical protein
MCVVSSMSRKRPNSRYCGGACRQRAKRAGLAGRSGVVREPPPTDSPLIRVVTAELEAAGQADSWCGRAALLMAQRLSDPLCPSSAVVPLSRELQRTMEWVMRDVWRRRDPLDEVKRRRDSKRLSQ